MVFIWDFSMCLGAASLFTRVQSFTLSMILKNHGVNEIKIKHKHYTRILILTTNSITCRHFIEKKQAHELSTLIIIQ